MKKLFLGILAFMVISSLSFVSAGDINITIYMEGEIVSPEPGYVSGTIDINWINVEDAYLKYQEGLCDDLSGGTLLKEIHEEGDGSYEWDTTEVEDGEYCIKLTWDNVLDNVSVKIDNTAPTIEFIGAPYFNKTSETITIIANITDVSGIDEWELDFGDESSEEGNTSDVTETHDYDEEGEYTVTLTATDNAGNIAEETALVVINDEEVDWIIPLYSDKMNLFSIPLMPENTGIKDVLPEEVSDNAEKIWSYQQGKWNYNTPTTSGWSTTTSRIQEIVPGYGYIIFMEDDSVVYGNGKELGAETPTGKVVLTAGWNLIGHRGTESKLVNQTLSGLKSVLSGFKYWSSIINSDGEELDDGDDMEPTKAYWIDMNSNDFETPEDKTFLY
jgi:PKD repeat protein